jgi:hypothetical protein
MYFKDSIEGGWVGGCGRLGGGLYSIYLVFLAMHCSTNKTSITYLHILI